MSDKRLTAMTTLPSVDKGIDNMLIDNNALAHRALLRQILGSGDGAANFLTYREEITEITDDMYESISDGTFDLVHTGMHYTAPSGRTWWLADANYYKGYGSTQQTKNHYLVVEDEISHTAQHQTTNTTAGGAAASLIYTTTLPTYQSEIEDDFGASHIITQSIYLTNAVSDGVVSGGAWQNLDAHLLTEKQVIGNDIRYTDGSNYFLNFLARERQLALFKNMPETLNARLADTMTRKAWLIDTVESAVLFGSVSGAVGISYASSESGLRRVFLIG